MDYRIQKEIAPGVFTAFEGSTSGDVVIVRKDSEGNFEKKSILSFSSSFIQQFTYDYHPFYHLHGFNDKERLISVIFDASFSQHVEFELCFDSIVASNNGELKGTIGSIEFYGAIHIDVFKNIISIIPIKYKRIVHGEQFYTAAFNGSTWDIYDVFHFEREKQIQESHFGDYELNISNAYHSPNKEHYICPLEWKYCHKENPFGDFQLALSRVLFRDVMKIAEHTEEPYPISDSEKICLIGCPRYSEKFEYDTVSTAYREFNPLSARYSYIVSRNGKKGLWQKNAINRHIMKASYDFIGTLKCDYYGQGYEVLACDYLDIVPNQENLLDGGENEPLGSCNSFSIKTESGWGVYDAVNHRTVLTPVFDGPATVIIGPEGYINSLNGKYGIIDKKGNIVVPFIYDKISIVGVDTRHYEDGWVIITDVQLELNGVITQKQFSFKNL